MAKDVQKKDLPRKDIQKDEAPAASGDATVVGKVTAVQHSTIDRTAELSEEVLASVEAGQRAVIDAVRAFMDTIDEVLPAIGERPSRREKVIDAALEMADRFVSTQYDFLRSVVRSADRTLGTGTQDPEGTDQEPAKG